MEAFVDEGDGLKDEIDGHMLLVRVGGVVIGNLAVVKGDHPFDFWRVAV